MSDIQAHLDRLASSPADPDSLSALAEAYEADGRFEALLHLYESEAQRLDDEAAADLLCTAASLCREKLSSLTRAEGYLRLALQKSPTHFRALRGLRLLYCETGDLGMAADTYELELAQTQDDSERALGWIGFSQLLSGSINRPDKALGAARNAVKIQEGGVEAHEELARVYGLLGRIEMRHQALIAGLKKASSLDAPPPVDGLLEALLTNANDLICHPRFHGSVREALELAKKHAVEGETTQRLAAELESMASTWEDRAAQWEQQAAFLAESDAQSAADHWLLAGELYFAYGKDEARSLAAAEKAQALVAGHEASLRFIEDVYASTEKYAALAAKLESMAASTRSPTAAVELYLKAALHCAVRLDDAASAARIYGHVLQVAPGNKIATNALVEHHRETKDWQAALAVLQVWAERATTAADQVAARYAMCQIYEDELQDAGAARPHYEAILFLEPMNQAAARALEEVYRKTGDHTQLASVLQAKAAGLEGEARWSVLQELGVLLAGSLSEPDQAMLALGEVYAHKPTVELRQQLEEIVPHIESSLRWPFVFEDALPAMASDAERIDALRALAAMHKTQGGDFLGALRVCRRILALDPNDAEATAASSTLLEAVAESGDKVSVFSEQAEEASETSEKISILKRLAQELVETHKDHVRAIEVFRSILTLDADDEEAYRGILDLYRRDAQWSAVAELLRAQLAKAATQAKGDASASLWFELAQVESEKLHLPDAAAASLIQALGCKPDYVEALDLLETLLAKVRNPVETANVLQQGYALKERWDRVAAMLEIGVQHAAESAERLKLLTQIFEIYSDRLSLPEQAMTVALRAYQIAPENETWADAVDKLAEATGLQEAATRAHRAAASILTDDKQRAARLRAARLSEKHQIDLALWDYLILLATTSSQDDAAAEGLMRVIGAGVATSELPKAAEEVMGTLEGINQDVFWRRLAELLEEKMDAFADASNIWRKILAENPSDNQAQDRLDALIVHEGDPNKIVEHLRARMAKSEDVAQKVQLGESLAAILAGELDDKSGAIAQLVETTEIFPGKESVWASLAGLYRESGELDQAGEAMLREIHLTTELEARIDKIMAYASFAAKEQHDLKLALSTVEDLFRESPGNAQGIGLLEEIRPLASGDVAVDSRLSEILLEAYRKAESWVKMVQLQESRLDALADPQERASIQLEIAKIKAERIDDVAGAYAMLEQAFHQNPQDTSLRERLEEIAETSNNWASLAAAYEGALGVVDDPDTANPIRRRLAEILDHRLERSADALTYYRASPTSQGVGALPKDLKSLDSMERILRSQEDAVQLVEVLDAILKALPSDGVDRRRAILAEMGKLCIEVVCDKPRAASILQILVTEDPKNLEGLCALRGILMELGPPEALAECLDALLALGPANVDWIEDHVRRGATMLALNKPEEAFKSYRQVLLKDREHADALLGLEGLAEIESQRLEVAQVLEPIYTASQDFAKLAWILEQRLACSTDLAQRKSLFRRIGDIQENRIDAKDAAFAIARRSLAEDPADLGVRMWIEKLATENDTLADLAQVYVEEAEKNSAPLDLQFHRRAAAILHEKLQSHADAALQYRAILEREARDEKALAGLEAIYRATQEHAQLAEILRIREQSTGGIERKREYLTEIASIQAGPLADFVSAVNTHREVLSIAPGDREALEQIEHLLSGAAAWDQLLAFYVEEIERLADKRGPDVVRHRLEFAFKRAQILDEQFNDQAEAESALSEVLREDPDHAPSVAYLKVRADAGILYAMGLLEKVYVARGDNAEYVKLLQAKLDQVAELDKRKHILLQMADAYDDALQSPEYAFACLKQAFGEDRCDFDILDRLQSHAERHGNWEEVVDWVGVDPGALPDPELRQKTLHRLGEISGDHWGEIDRAIDFWQQALQFEPSDEKALAALDGLMVRNEMWGALADVLERRCEIAQTPEDKSGLLERLAEVWGQRLMDAEAALRCHTQILEIDPDHPISLKSMQKLYLEIEDWDALASNLDRQAEVLDAPEDQIRIHAAAGQLYGEELGDNAQAMQHWACVLEHDPIHDDATVALDVLYTTEEKWELLAGHLRHQLQHCQDADVKLQINRRLGTILGEKLGRDEDAQGSWQSVLEQDEKNVEALRALIALHNERAEWDGFVAMARRLIPLVDPTEAKDVRLELIHVLAHSLGDKEEAIRVGREVRSMEPHTVVQLLGLADCMCHIEAWDEAVVALERSGSLGDDDVSARIERYYRAANIYAEKMARPLDAKEALEAIVALSPEDEKAYRLLSDVYRQTQDFRKLVSLNDTYLDHEEDAASRLQILVEIRDVTFEHLGEKDLAFIAACRVYKENPRSLDSADVLEKIALATESAEECAAVLEDEVEGIVGDEEIRIALYHRIANIYGAHVDDIESAEAAYGRILDLNGADLEALDGLAQLGAKAERYDKQIAAFERKLTQVSEDNQRKSILFQLAHVWEDRVGEGDEAIAALCRVVEMDGGDLNALEGLARLYEAESMWSELAHTLTRKVEVTPDPAENLKLRARVAAICESELNDPDAAIQWYRGVLELDRGHKETLHAMERLYTGLERWSELISVLELQLELDPSVEDKIMLLSKAAQLYEQEFDAPKDAAACFERLLVIDASHVPGIKNLERLLRILGEWTRLIEVLEHHIGLVQNPTEVTELYLEMGEVYYRELSRVDKAEQIYVQARKLDPNSESALHALGTLYERSGNWFQSLEMLQKEADNLAGDPRSLSILMRLGRINEDMLSDTEGSKKAYQSALGVDPSYGPALEALKEIAQREEDWEAYAEYLITEAETADDDEEKTDLFLEAAKFFSDVRNDEDGAIRYYLRSLETTPGNLPASLALAEVFFKNEAWEEAGQHYKVVVASLDKSDDASDFCHKSYRLGYISEKNGAKEEALAYYRQAFEADSTYLPALEGLGQSLVACEEWDDATKVFQTILIHHRENLTESEVVDIQWQLGDICVRMQQIDRAATQFEKALAIDPDHGPSLLALSGLDENRGRWEPAFLGFMRYAEIAPGAERVEIWARAAGIAKDKLSDLQRSIDALDKIRRSGSAPTAILEQLAHIHMEANQPQKAVEVMEEAAESSEDPERKSALYYRLGQIYETSIKHEPQAVQRYNAALDAHPTHIQAFEAIERILGARQEWSLLEANYRAMVARAAHLSPAIRLVLWRNLAELYRKVFGRIDDAIVAYEVVQKLEPDNIDTRRVLSGLYAQKPERLRDAIALEHGLLRDVENPVEPIKALRKLYHGLRDFDAVYVMCGALIFLNAADDEEKKIFEYLGRGVPARASQAMSEEGFAKLQDADLGAPLGRLSEAIVKGASEAVLKPAKDLGLKKRDFVDLRSSELYFANMVRYVSRMLNVSNIQMYKKGGSMEPLGLMPSSPPALVVGENASIMQQASQRVALFQLGQAFAYARAEALLPRVFSGEEFRDLMFGFCTVYNQSLEHAGDAKNVEKWQRTFEKLPGPTLKRMQNLAQETYASLKEPDALMRFLAAVDRFAGRVGFLVSGDLISAVRGIQEHPEGAVVMQPRERIKDVVLFAVSEKHLQLRKELGMSIVENKG